MYETFDHTADLGIRLQAETLEKLLAEAGRAFFDVILANLDSVHCVQEESIRISGDNIEYLLVDWLSELLFLFESRRMVFARFDVRLDQHGIEAIVSGEPLDEARHLIDHEVKAVTYHELKIQQNDNGWMAEVIVDI